MATIADTLNDIQKLQKVMSIRCKEFENRTNDRFVHDLMNFTTIYFFSLFSHATLDSLRDRLQPISHPYADKYYSMYKQTDLLQELIRLDNISGMFLLWNILEQYIERTRDALPGDLERDVQGRYKTILRHVGIKQPRYDTMINEFNLIRLTRNSLHSGGVYLKKRKLTFTLNGRDYVLEMGKRVTPIRLMDVANTMWDHFVTVADQSGP